MTDPHLIGFLEGVVTTLYLTAAGFFLQFHRRTQSRLFRTFGIAFALLAVSQIAGAVLGTAEERSAFAYIPRVVGYLLIVYAIVRENVRAGGRT